jgi:hypothetical protein
VIVTCFFFFFFFSIRLSSGAVTDGGLAYESSSLDVLVASY